ncbi:daunorubicin/doxorubicin resistance ATP-binding protein DrrA [bacterium BMS3Abin14]|nr:daunorubicin/doxorubicin resistance ATP-binding protein DrrA [bacterium BMS3Abin14]
MPASSFLIPHTTLIFPKSPPEPVPSTVSRPILLSFLSMEDRSNIVVRTDKLTRTFGVLKAVDSLDLVIASGEIFGLLGPNGAGKTTTLSMLATLLKPTSGTAVVAGHDVVREKDQVRRLIGLVFQDPSTDEELTAWENMDFHGRLYAVPREIRKSRIPELLEMVDLADRSKDRVKTFSGGMKRRLEIARGFLHHPAVLFLDEPTTGLDPQTRRRIWDHILHINSSDGLTVLLTTHSMEEADALCGRVAIMDHGKMIALGSPRELKDGLGGDVISIETDGDEALCSALENEEWITAVRRHSGQVDISVTGGEGKIPAILHIADRAGVITRSITLKKPTLEDVFIHHTGRTIRDEGGNAVDRMRQRRKAFSR